MIQLPLFPVTTVGSWPRPAELVQAFGRKRRGEMTARDFDSLADRAVLAALRTQEEAGVDLVTDGEQRRDNFYSFVAERLDGVQLMTLAEMLDIVEDKEGFGRLLATLDVPAFSISNPTCVGEIRRRAPLAVEDLLFLRNHTDKPIKVTLPGPYLLTRAMWVKEVTRGVYPTKEDLGEAVVEVLRRELAELCAAGAAFVQFDEPVLTELVFTQGRTRTFMCAALAARQDPAEELAFAVSLINRVVDGVRTSNPPAPGRTPNDRDAPRTPNDRDCTPNDRDSPRTMIGLHVCRGNWSRDERTLLRGSYAPLAGYFEAMHVDQLVLEYATPRAGAFVPVAGKSIGLGVVNPRVDTIESPAAIVDRVRRVLADLPPEQVFLNPDCGFATFTSRAVNSADTAKQKLGAMSEAAQVLRGSPGCVPGR